MRKEPPPAGRCGRDPTRGGAEDGLRAGPRGSAGGGERGRGGNRAIAWGRGARRGHLADGPRFRPREKLRRGVEGGLNIRRFFGD